MKIVGKKIVFTKAEIKMLDEQNPTMFAVMVWVNKHLPNTFTHKGKPIDKDYKFNGVIYYSNYYPGSCFLDAFGSYSHGDNCTGLDCWDIGDVWTSCLELTWLEYTGKKKKMYRHNTCDVEQRRFLLKRMVVEQKGIRVV